MPFILLQQIMKKITVVLLACFITVISQAQTVSVKVLLQNDKNEILQGATVKVLDTGGILLLQKILLQDNSFPLKPNSVYLLRITAASVKPIEQQIAIAEKDTTIFIRYAEKVKNLDAVVVTSRKPLVSQQDDKTIVDAEVLANSSTNAYEVLEKTPGANVDQDGKV